MTEENASEIQKNQLETPASEDQQTDAEQKTRLGKFSNCCGGLNVKRIIGGAIIFAIIALIAPPHSVIDTLTAAIVGAVVGWIYSFPIFHNIRTILKKELKSYFNSPIAYVLIVIFLLAAQSFAFLFGGFFERQEASLTQSFFFWHPWLFMIFAPALGMRIWSEEQRLGTIELLLTMPIAPWEAIMGKFLAAATVLFASLLLTFPAWWTINWLGSPDNGVIWAGYIGSLFVALTFLAITGAISAVTRSQVVCFVISVALCLVCILAGFDPVVGVLNSWGIGHYVAEFSVLTHFFEMSKGILVSTDVLFFLSVIGFSLYLTSVILRSKRA